MSTNQGQTLAALTQHFHSLRAPYLKWAETYQQANEVMLGHFRRALIGWYEARTDEDNPYLGEAHTYVETVANLYFTGKINEAISSAELLPVTELGLLPNQNPLNHLPRPVHLNNTQQLMFAQFRELGKSCRELLLMTDYHRISRARIAEIIGQEGRLEEVEDRRDKCLLMVREAWQAGGITDPVRTPSPTDEDLIDRYYAGELSVTERWDVEARRPVDAVFRRAMELREDWAGVITVAGRQDLMETLLREEGKYAQKRTVATKAAKVKLSPRRKGGIQLGKLELPSLETILAVVLFGVFSWLAWTTFGPAAPQQRSVANFQPFPNIFDRTPPRTPEEEDLQRILYYYDQGYYAEAYDELLPVADAYPAAPLYLGVSAMALKQPGVALDWFERVAADDYYHPFTEWYEALAYLAEGNRLAAEQLLQEVTETRNHPYRTQAVRLLADL